MAVTLIDLKAVATSSCWAPQRQAVGRGGRDGPSKRADPGHGGADPQGAGSEAAGRGRARLRNSHWGLSGSNQTAPNEAMLIHGIVGLMSRAL